ncbi:Z1 domain-containing protein [Brachybacterium muris]|nr:Z1 domain-containing protein [Brachybacterium muris]
MAPRVSESEREMFGQPLDMLEGALDRGRDERALLETLNAMFPGFQDFYDRWILDQRDRIELIEFGGGLVKKPAEARPPSWYRGSRRIGEWVNYRNVLGEKLPEVAIGSLDLSTERIVGMLANPVTPHDKRKGLVVGYVQSGKTANYTGVIAKAIDQGYRIIIVLSGMHTNLRRQTQVRLVNDLRTQQLLQERKLSYVSLTSADGDFADPQRYIANLGNAQSVLIGVVKKNVTRLDRVAEFLRQVNRENPDMLLDRPVLIIDDESDQATPNSAKLGAKVTAINGAIRAIWAQVKTGAYVAYTATPFANIFINPADKKDLYPEDFVASLPRPDGYMGVKEFFGSTRTADKAESAEQLEHRVSRDVSAESEAVLVPRGRDITGYAPEMVPELKLALHWFLIATAVRRLREETPFHSSMLVHTSHRVHAHERLADVIESYLTDVSSSAAEIEEDVRALFLEEIDQASELRSRHERPDWAEVWAQITTMLEQQQVIVRTDNAASKERLEYPDDDPQTVIAVGGGTLSRGLTLEGLVTSFFLRTSNTYDTLLQMGRWFGFRFGYADLVRVWVAPGLMEEYAFLAEVEEDLRGEIARMDKENLTPAVIGLKVMLHPGRLQITAGNKMRAAQLVEALNGGQRYQVTYLDKSTAGIQRNQIAAERLIRTSLDNGAVHIESESGHLLRSVTSISVLEFLEDAWIPAAYPWMQADAVKAWLEKNAPDATWNIALMSPRGERPTYSFTEGISVRTASRTPEKKWSPLQYEWNDAVGADLVNIRALLTEGDELQDIQYLDAGSIGEDRETRELIRAIQSGSFKGTPADMRRARHHLLPGEGLIILYAIDKDSTPSGKSKQTRKAMAAEDHLVGIGLVYPSADDPDEERQRMAVDPAAAYVTADDDEDDIAEDNEGDHDPRLEELK